MIISISLPRTGTTSLALALEQLGLKVFQHCPITNSKNEMTLKAICESGVCNRFDAVVSSYLNVDMTQKWVENYQEASFICCTRNEEDRLKSLAKFTDYTENISIADRIKCQNILVGTKNYLELPMRISDADKWYKLCSFLNKPIPNTPYPKENMTS